MPEPIKRVEALQPLSRDHHHALLLCWKIKEGINRKIEYERIKRYTDWFWDHYLEKHFADEEAFVFTVLGNEHKWVKKALAEHRRLKKLFKNQKDICKSLSLIEEELRMHIRFEERVLFNAIQSAASSEQLRQIEMDCSDKIFNENLSDPFWQ